MVTKRIINFEYSAKMRQLVATEVYEEVNNKLIATICRSQDKKLEDERIHDKAHICPKCRNISYGTECDFCGEDLSSINTSYHKQKFNKSLGNALSKCE